MNVEPVAFKRGRGRPLLVPIDPVIIDEVRSTHRQFFPNDDAEGRQTLMYLVSVSLGYRAVRTAAALKVTHPMIWYAAKKIEDRRDDPTFDAKMNSLETTVAHLTEDGN